jgi:biopolymer transport protein ExbD
MIDITFLLLIFFLVSSTPDKDTAIKLPEALHGTAVSQLESVVFTLAQGGLETAPLYAADGKIAEAALSEEPETRGEEVREAVRQGIAENKTKVVIKADRGVAYRHVSDLIDLVSEAAGIELFLAVLDTD